jgi:hypothetical protein
MDEGDEPVEDLLVQRVVDEAQRRRVRRAVAAGVITLVAAGGVAIGLTHRFAAEPAAHDVAVVAANDGAAERAEIQALVQARYASTAERGPHRTHVEFGRLIVTGTRARLQVNIVCVPLCGHGEEVSLAYRDGSWQITGTRVTWLS